MLRIHPEMIVMDVVVTMAGELDDASIRSFRHWLGEITGNGPTVVTIEASQIECPDDEGVQALVMLAANLREEGGELRLLNPSLWMRRQLTYSDLQRVVSIYESQPEEEDEL